MNYDKKVELAHAETREKGVLESHSNPPIFRLMRKVNVRIAPPYYQSFKSNFLTCFLYFTPLSALGFWLLSNQSEPITLIKTSLISGVLYASNMSLFYHYRRRQLKLTKWESFGSETQT